jgi:hypothetical protein
VCQLLFDYLVVDAVTLVQKLQAQGIAMHPKGTDETLHWMQLGIAEEAHPQLEITCESL